MKKENFLEISKKILVEPDKEVLLNLEKEYDFISENLKFLDKIDIKNVEPMSRISPSIKFENLREDIAKDVFSKEEVLKNAKENDEDFIIIKRTIK